MGPSFYEFIIRYVDESAKDPMSRLANAVSKDISFPKQSHDFQEISDYLEKNSHFSRLVTIFDDAWRYYQDLI